MASPLRYRAAAVMLAALVASPASAQITVYENDYAGWLAAASPLGSVYEIDFEIPSGPITGTEFSALPGNPLLTSVSGTMTVTTAADYFPGNYTATSGTQIYLPNAPMAFGVTRVSVGSGELRAIGMWYLDVESGFESSGFDFDDNAAPMYHFSADQGNNSQSFFGIVSAVGFTSVDMHMNSQASEGAGGDDLVYVLEAAVPTNPGTWGAIKQLFR